MILILLSNTLSRLLAYSSTSDPGLSTSLSRDISSLTMLTTSSMWLLWAFIRDSSSSRIYSISYSWSLHSSSVLSPYLFSSSSWLIIWWLISGSSIDFTSGFTGVCLGAYCVGFYCYCLGCGLLWFWGLAKDDCAAGCMESCAISCIDCPWMLLAFIPIRFSKAPDSSCLAAVYGRCRLLLYWEGMRLFDLSDCLAADWRPLDFPTAALILLLPLNMVEGVLFDAWGEDGFVLTFGDALF